MAIATGILGFPNLFSRSAAYDVDVAHLHPATQATVCLTFSSRTARHKKTHFCGMFDFHVLVLINQHGQSRQCCGHSHRHIDLQNRHCCYDHWSEGCVLCVYLHAYHYQVPAGLLIPSLAVGAIAGRVVGIGMEHIVKFVLDYDGSFDDSVPTQTTDMLKQPARPSPAVSLLLCMQWSVPLLLLLACLA